MSIVDIETAKPHITIYGRENKDGGKLPTFVSPVSMFEDIVSGKLKGKDVEGLDDMLPTIIDEWLGIFGL